MVYELEDTKKVTSLFEGWEMKNWNKKMIMVVFLIGILIFTGCATMEENVSEGHFDNTKDSAFNLEENVREKYDNLVKYLIKSNISITTMESCTAGQIASLLTDTSGSSAIIKGAFISYSNEAKIRLGVSEIDKESSKFGARKIGAFSNFQAPNLVLSL